MKGSLAAATAAAALVLAACGSEAPDTVAGDDPATVTVTATVTETVTAAPPKPTETPTEEPAVSEEDEFALLDKSFESAWNKNELEDNIKACEQFGYLSAQEQRETVLELYSSDLSLSENDFAEHMLGLWEKYCSSDEIAGEMTTQGGDVKFGRTVEYADGLAVTVTKPEVVNLSSGAGGEGFPYRIHFDVTITNNTGGRIEPMPMVSVQSGNREGDQIYDMRNGIEGAPMLDTLLDGRSLTWTAAFGIDDPDDVLVFVTPSFIDYDEIVFSD